MSEISSITFSIKNDTFQIVNDKLLIWKGTPDHMPDLEIEIQDLRNVMQSASFLRKDNGY
jgi:hypothetical protein